MGTISGSKNGTKCGKTEEGGKRRINFKFSVDMPNEHFSIASYKGGCSSDSETPDFFAGGDRLVEMTPGAKPRILSATGCAGRRAPRKQTSLADLRPAPL